MALALYAALFFQVVRWVYAERLTSSTDAPMASKAPILDGPNTSLKPMLPIIIGSALGGFVGFLLVVFLGVYIVRRRRSRAVDNVVEGAHFPTMAYHSGYPNTSPPISANSQMYSPYVGYTHWEKPDESAPTMPPGLPVAIIRS